MWLYEQPRLPNYPRLSWRSRIELEDSSYFKTNYKSTVIKMVWYRHKDRQIHQCNRIASAETDLFSKMQKWGPLQWNLEQANLSNSENNQNGVWL